MRRRMLFEVFGVVGQPGQVLRFDHMQAIGKRSISISMMMPVGFPVGGDVNQLRPVPGRGKGVDEPSGKAFPAVQKPAESNVPGYGIIIEKEGDGFSGREQTLVGS